MKKTLLFTFIVTLFLGNRTANAQVDFTNVQEIFWNNCTSCHHAGYLPIHFGTYDEIALYSGAIKLQLETDRMPPWPADSTYVHYTYEPTLTEEEKYVLLQWIEDGSLEGDPTAHTTPPTFSPSRAVLAGTADLEYLYPMFESQADANDKYYNFEFQTNYTEDKWIRAVEIIPSNPEIMHHANIMVDTTGTAVTDTTGDAALPPGQFLLGAYSGWPLVYPNTDQIKAGIRVPAGSQFVLQTHMAPGSIGESSDVLLRVYFYDSSEIANLREIKFLLQELAIIPGLYLPKDEVTTITKSYTLPGAVSLLAVFPHSHTVCRSVLTWANVGADTVPLIRINDWFEAYQRYYNFNKMIHLPAGSSITASHVFDNTVNNPYLFHYPPEDVWGGLRYEDEMFADTFEYLDYMPGDENINMDSIVLNDPLIIPKLLSVPEGGKASFNLDVFPNPSSNSVTVSATSGSVYMARLINLAGQTVYVSPPFNGNVTVDVKDMIAGNYVVEVIDTHKNVVVSKQLVIVH